MDIFNALADHNRRRIIELLASSGKLSATDISEKFKVSPPAISQHLKVLREAKLVDMEKRAQQRIYTINTSSLEQLEIWAHKMKAMWEKKFTNLDKLLAKMNRGDRNE